MTLIEKIREKAKRVGNIALVGSLLYLSGCAISGPEARQQDENLLLFGLGGALINKGYKTGYNVSVGKVGKGK